MVKVSPVEHLDPPATGSRDVSKNSSTAGSVGSGGHRLRIPGSEPAPRRPSTLLTAVQAQHLRASAAGMQTDGKQLAWKFHSWRDSDSASSVRRGLRGRWFTALTIICLFNALFLYDLFVVCQVPSNAELDGILTAVFAVFFVEFVGLSLVDANYVFSFFFWMDLIGTSSMLFDISYLLGSDATREERVRDNSASDNVILVRAARAAKLGARAGRLSRVLKILRFLPFLYDRENDKHKVKMARVITNRLNTVLAQRVSFLTICIVVMMPIFNLFQYPERDHSFTSWAELLAKSVREAVQEMDGASDASRRLASETQRFSDFYRDLNYGPYKICYGVLNGDAFDCQPEVLELSFASPFEDPRRKASVTEVSTDNFQASFDMSTVEIQQAAANMASVLLVIVVMVGFGLVMSNSISAVALTPLERMLSVVRERCKQIFKFANGIQDDSAQEQDEDAGEQDNEFQLLEDVVVKLAAIASLSTTNEEPQVTDHMNEEDVTKLNWMQGATAVQAQQAATSGHEHRPRASMFMPKPNAHEAAVGDITSEGGSRHNSRQPSKVQVTVDVPAPVLASLDTDGAGVLDWSKEMKLSVAALIIRFRGSSADWVQDNVDEQKLLKFISTVEAGYLPNPFHNFSHAVDVLYQVSRFFQLIDAGNFLTEVSEYLLLTAALAHDLGHLGINNQFLVETSHELALKYNDHCPMEMMHCARLFQIVREARCDIFANLEKELYKEVRKSIIAAILHTDMTKHADMIKELGLLYQMNSEEFDRLRPSPVVNASQQNVQMTLNALLHCADVGNPMKPWDQCTRYAHLCLDEFFAQGDKEKELGVPVQFLNDRTKVNRENSQIGFIEFVIAPLCEACVHIFPQLEGLAQHLGSNICKWNEAWQAESSPDQSEIDKVDARTQKVSQRCQALVGSRRATAEQTSQSPRS